MPERAVPVHMGSPRFETYDARSSLVTLLWFPPGAVLEPHVHDSPTFAVILSGGFDLAFTNPAIPRQRLSCPRGTILTQPAGERFAPLRIVQDGGGRPARIRRRTASERARAG